MHQFTIIGNDPTDGTQAVNIVYYKLGNLEIPDDTMPMLTRQLGCKIYLCRSWAAFVSVLNTLSVNHSADLILLDEDAYSQLHITPAELSMMLSVMGRCAELRRKIPIGAVVERLTSHDKIKELHNSDIAGIVPGSAEFGYENTLLAISSLLHSKSYWSKGVTDLVSKARVTATKTGIQLTNRQTQVLNLVCNRGLSNKKIASTLKISESTVKVHMSAILKEYGVRNRTQLALAATSSLRP